jgi:hypothetical protein
MFNFWKKAVLCNTVTSQFTGHDHAAVFTHRAPKLMLYALDANEHFVQVPLVPRSRPVAARTSGEALAEFPASAPYGLMGDANAPLGQQQFHVPKAETECVILPDGVADDLGVKAMAVAWVRRRFHPAVPPVAKQTARLS